MAGWMEGWMDFLDPFPSADDLHANFINEFHTVLNLHWSGPGLDVVLPCLGGNPSKS